jgi:hypothetical protein
MRMGHKILERTVFSLLFFLMFQFMLIEGVQVRATLKTQVDNDEGKDGDNRSNDTAANRFASTFASATSLTMTRERTAITIQPRADLHRRSPVRPSTSSVARVSVGKEEPNTVIDVRQCDKFGSKSVRRKGTVSGKCGGSMIVDGHRAS